MPYYVLLGGSRNGERVVCDHELRELRLPARTTWGRVDEETIERYRIMPERRDGFTVARLVTAVRSRALMPARISVGYASTS